MNDTTNKTPQTRHERTKRRHDKVRQFFHDLFDVQRIRMDDAIKRTAERFDYAESTVERIVFRGE